ncbi:hypothetical protein P8C59_005694 [Phyllachora maydis]|uniref:DNA repair metallo-beta-lactamase domain-containing protein n=1 Tax=Phyllachora maydis TaxID=1825666 RepID=A0AAD9I4X5_9PEZI|nr:hypothetical protein P8C59_005694 [Phyllachora maydis]
MGAEKARKTPQRKAAANGSKKAVQTKLNFSNHKSTKKPPTPNASILDFFQKTGDERLFVDDELGKRLKDEDEDVATNRNGYEEEEDTYSAGYPPLEPRFNELDVSTKRRRLSPPDPEGLPTWEASERAEDKPARKAAPKKRRRNLNNPFVTDSSDDDDGSNSSAPGLAGDDSAQNGQNASGPRPRPGPVAVALSKVPAILEEEVSAADVSSAIQRELKKGEQSPEDMSEFDEAEMDLLDEGEEFRERRYMREQARLEAAEAGVEAFDDDFLLPDDAVIECCPICEGSLVGVTADQATAHVNSCLDGKPTRLPNPNHHASSSLSASAKKARPPDQEVEGRELGKRFARAAVARPGQANPIALDGIDTCPGSTSTSASASSSTPAPGPAAAAGTSAFLRLMSGHAENAAWQTAAAAEHAARGKPAHQRTCPFYKIMPGFAICVDAFRYGKVEGCQAYFLSHFHSDHYIGLTASWTHGPIYCSAVTASLVRSQLRTAAQFVVELAFEARVPVPGTPGVCVTMIPANHCPGSALFLFEKTVAGERTQRILHCGDFRACPAHVAHPQLRPDTVDRVTGKTRRQKIDVCYLDTTYLNPRYSFPPQDDVIRACADVCKALSDGLARGEDEEWQTLLRRREGGPPPGPESVSKFFTSDKQEAEGRAKDGRGKSGTTPASKASPPTDNAFTALASGAAGARAAHNRLLVVCGTYSIGKERICKAIAQALGTRIFASAAKIRMVRQLGDAELAGLMTSDPGAAQVHMQMLMEIRADTLADYLDTYRRLGFARVVGFRPSGWSYRPAAGTAGSGRSVGANAPPSSVPSAQLLHGAGWRTRFATSHLAPQRGSGRDALCFGVPYSEHSSFRELAVFLMALRIERVVPTVNVGSEQSRKRMKGWIDRWIAERRKGGLVTVLEGDGDGDGQAAAGEVNLWEGKDGKGGGVYW